MKIQPWLLTAFAGLAMAALSCPAGAVTILFNEAANSVNGQEVLPVITTTVTGLGTCASGTAPPCVLRVLNADESTAANTAVATLRVPTGTFKDPDATRPPGLPALMPEDQHVARAYLLESLGVFADISDVATLQFFPGGQLGTGTGVFDDVEVRFVSDSDSPGSNLGRIPAGFVFRTAEDGSAIGLNGSFFTGPVDNAAQQRAYCQSPPCGALPDLPTGYTVTARSDAPESMPEPATLFLLGAGFAGLGIARRVHIRGRRAQAVQSAD
ncbi:PEP-CTERM sorting domain-containing protein [Limobrevibacterium gyesilva]|uniref:PEP-CTERM sorting domain-containing protein n=1 Tax=Limobrevibacterium gyesilva TaxID=2991712 RepID=A0AA41YTE6_9PROT|nr:PEP-CTERM sorting domain-containing protein [Limobrevibacterium gyesilva]MCW3476140.1 PEP-CTERM sorting domain-containing protein [Limobrevibacterium gyesilva]